MKTKTQAILTAAVLLSHAGAQTASTTYTNFIRQTQMPDGVTLQEVDKSNVDKSGQRPSTIAVEDPGARFDLHTVSSDPFASYLLDTRYVGASVPRVEIKIRTEDTSNGTISTTRADRPIYVDITVEGLMSGEVSEAAKQVKLYHHIQSYGENGDGTNIDRSLAILKSQSLIKVNGTQTLTFMLSSVPGSDFSKLRGEETFSVFSIEDFQAPEAQLAKATVQVWPVATGKLTGITPGETLRFSVPSLNISVDDLYPGSGIEARIYPGPKRNDGFLGTLVTGSGYVPNATVPVNHVLPTLDNWSSAINKDGEWTMVLLSPSAFGIDELDSVTFNVDRKITVNGGVTTAE